MSTANDDAKRLLDLERILAQSRSGESTSGDADPVTLHIADVPVERIRRFTAELQGANGDRDEIAAVTTRLLLNDYTTAVAHLRAVARISVTRIESALEPIRQCQKFLRHEEKIATKQQAAADRRPAES
jgi:hypothetical protein